MNTVSFFSDYPWSGSLRPVSSKMGGPGRKPGRGDGDDGASPWAGSLRHIDAGKMRKKKQQRRDDGTHFSLCTVECFALNQNIFQMMTLCMATLLGWEH